MAFLRYAELYSCMVRERFILAAVFMLFIMILPGNASADSPYGDILNSIGKKQNTQINKPAKQPKTGAQHKPSKAPPAKTDSKKDTPTAIPWPNTTDTEKDSTVRIPPKQVQTRAVVPASPDVESGNKEINPLEGEKIKAKLDLEVTFGGSVSSSKDTSQGSYSGMKEHRFSSQGRIELSLSFIEKSAFPGIKHQRNTQTLLVGIGKGDLVLDETNFTKDSYNDGAYQGWDQSNISRRCRGVKRYEPNSDITETEAFKQSGMKLPAGMQNIPASYIWSSGQLDLQERADGSKQFTFDTRIEAECLIRENNQSDRFSSNDEHRETTDIRLVISGSLTKGQDRLVLGPEHVTISNLRETVRAHDKTRKVDYSVKGSFQLQPKPGKLLVSPKDVFSSQGPGDNKKFTPESKKYTLKNTGGSPISYGVEKKADWLKISDTNGKLDPGQSSTLTISIDQSAAKKLKTGSYTDVVNVSDKSAGKSDNLNVKLKVGEEQTWRVKVWGYLWDDIGGEILYVIKDGKQTTYLASFGGKFHGSMTAEFVIKKVKGDWVYKEGSITSAKFSMEDMMDKSVYDVVSTNCLNCALIEKNLAGSPLGGTVKGKTVKLNWPIKPLRGMTHSKFKLKSAFRKKDMKHTSNYEFEGELFFVKAASYVMPMKNGAVGPVKEPFKGAPNDYSKKFKMPLRIHRSMAYSLKRID